MAPVPAPESDAETRRAVRNRLRRAQGQLAALIDAVDDGADCRDAVTQLSAVSRALDRAGFLMIAHAMRDCVTVTEEDRPEGTPTVAELEKLFLTLA
ncbi:metal-sensitive transcriptional regulator [Leucobacter sp. M11]|nr:metal-sensitive transcriptional regulator [Leucobacter sp. M11]